MIRGAGGPSACSPLLRTGGHKKSPSVFNRRATVTFGTCQSQRLVLHCFNKSGRCNGIGSDEKRVGCYKPPASFFLLKPV